MRCSTLQDIQQRSTELEFGGRGGAEGRSIIQGANAVTNVSEFPEEFRKIVRMNSNMNS